MEKSRIWVLVILLLALLFFCSMDAEASTQIYEETKTFSELRSPTIWATNELGLTSNTAVFDRNENYNLLLGTNMLADRYYNLNISIYANENVYKLEGDIDSTCNFRYYILYAGEKYYFNSNYSTLSIVVRGNEYTHISVGCEFELSAKTFFDTSQADIPLRDAYVLGSSVITLYTRVFELENKNVAELSLLDNINNSLNTQGSIIVNALQNLGSTISSKLDEIWNVELLKLDNMQTSLETKLTSIDTRLKNIYGRFDIKLSTFRTSVKGYIETLQTNMISKFDELKQALTRDYDATGAESTNTALSGSLDSWEAAEGATMDDAKIEVSSYDTSSAFTFAPALVSSLSLVTAFSTGFLNASGDFTTAITVMFSLVFVSVMVGLVRFVRR